MTSGNESRKYGILIIGVVIIMSLFGCGKTKYNLIFDGGFQSKKTSYAEGEQVTVIYDIIATDTDYSFYTDSEDVDLKQEYDDSQGYVFTFTMPAHDVKLFVKSRNTMEYDPDANRPENDPGSPGEAINEENLRFDYYEATVATQGGDCYTKYALYEYEMDRMILAQFEKEPEGEEKMSFCFVPASVLDECMEVIKKYKMQNWKGETGLRGKEYAVRFSDDGELQRVSSDHMPENGREAFEAVSEVLAEAWSQQYSALDTETWFCPECGTKNERKYCSECGLEKPE